MKRIIMLIGLSAMLALTSCSTIGDNNRPLTSQEINKNIEQVLTVLDQSYVYPETANKMRAHVESNVSTGHYDQVHSLRALIEILQDDLRAVSNDGHISLHLAKSAADRKVHARPITEFSKPFYTEISAGEKVIGYLKFDIFSNKVLSKNTITKLMNELSSTDALIIDLRDNVGGDPSLVAFLSSYFVEGNTLLWSVINRQGETVIEVFSEQQDIRYLGKVCLLTSKKTYSAAEAFAYTLKHLGRACIIGEATGGGAHLVQMEQVNDELDIRIPVARAFNPITKSNWEDLGVIPTIKVEAANAKVVAIGYLNNSDK